MSLEKPIFVIGHARGGSTLLGAIINNHSQVGPKYLEQKVLDTEKFKAFGSHLNFSEKLEQKEIWFKYFTGKDCFTHMGKEIYEENLKLSPEQIDNLVCDLTENFREERFLSKSPTNTFRINLIKEIFPDSKIVVILRRGEEVVASWGRRNYGFGKKVAWGNLNIKKLSYFRGINIFSKKWEEVIDVVKDASQEHEMLLISYDDLIEDTQKTLKNVFHYLELPPEHYITEIVLQKDNNKWKENIPWIYQLYLRYKTKNGNKELREMGVRLN